MIEVLGVHLVVCVGVGAKTAACTRHQYPRMQIRVLLERANPVGPLAHEYAPSQPHGFFEQDLQCVIECRGTGLFEASRSCSHPLNREGER